ncbi:PR domain zinc finger protein 2 [Cololabis saira]|uniref:PR domain zinc finger protein 2 n=1 Tax=Cololabis saira TaxID=129043 RepID=UPI002AD22DF0|nr:PR domain zinc finger protein 2 [Cololabis saira]XP_061592441.1 PR domain zinc finger protein 2 [Cololabis saira]XP_061592442.1 PR domain zinc finger protein 2 [Cololabis saira]XP_061592443.1 PR domain zinc finger protein 2 [Cololabis saira]
MEDSSYWSISELGDDGDIQEEDGIYQDKPSMASELIETSINPKQNTEDECFLCQHCERRFGNREDLERHMHIHAFTKNDAHETETKLLQEESPHKLVSDSSQHQIQFGENTAQGEEREHAEQYMLDVSSNISENLSFYIDGKIVSTSTVSNCELAEVHAGSSALVGLDALIVDPPQICEVLKTDKEIPGQQYAKRRTATPPLLPQIKTELESEVVVSSSSSSLVSTIMENLFPQNSESIVVQKERTVFLSPKLKQLLEKQDGLKPTLALISDGQKPSSPISLSALPSTTGRFKRRTGSPTSSQQQNPTSNEETQVSDTGEVGPASTGQIETQHSSHVQQTANENDDATLSVVEPVVKPVLSNSWPPVTGGNSCNQRPLDLSNTVKRNEDVASVDAVLDLSLQRKNPGESELAFNFVSLANQSNASMVENALMKMGEQKMNLGGPNTPVVTDFTIVTGSEIVTPLEPVTEGLVYGLTLPQSSLTPSPASFNPMTLEPGPPCTIAFASPAQTVLSTAPSLITVLAPSSIANSSTQPIQVVAPNIPPEPMVICTESSLTSQCDLTTAFAATNSANIVTLSQPLDPTLNLPGHVFLTDQIAISPPMVESTARPEVPFTPTVNFNDSLFNSYNIASNTVLIECTIALEAPGSVVPAAVPLQENTAEPPAPTQMVVNHIKQQQIVSVTDPQSVEPTVLVSSITESATLINNTEMVSDCPALSDSSSDPDPVVDIESPTIKDEEASDSSLSNSEIAPKISSPSPEKAEEESSNIAEADSEPQTFTKNFICNVCDKLFHSMKELSHHVGDHADEWPYKCEFCVLLFGEPSDLHDHRSSLHGVGKTYVCSACTKEFVYLCNLKQHQEELHPGQQCTYTEDETGKLRPQNYNNSTKVNTGSSANESPADTKKLVKKEECEVDVAAEELFTTLKIMATDGGKIKGPDVRLGINQHYPSFKPPPFPYHNRSPAGSVASATNFTTHNIPQTFSTAIRCTKCGKSFDNMPELHKHILACANASDKKRYTPRKNPIPLRHFAKSQNGVLSTTNSANGLNASVRVTQGNRPKPSQDPPVKFRMLKKRKKKLVQRVMPQRNKSVPSSNKVSQVQVNDQQEIFVCPHCKREFTMRRSRTKHMAVCPKKPKEIKKRKEGGISVTKENNGHLHRGVSHVREKQEPSPQHKTRLQTSGLTKRPAILPVQTVLSSKRSKIIIKGSTQLKQEAPTLAELPIRTFNPSMRQYSKVQQNIKGMPIKITVVRPQQTTAQKNESRSTQSRQEAANGQSEQSTSA